MIVYPIPASISLTPDTGRTIYTPGVTATLTCNVTGDCTVLYYTVLCCTIMFCTVLSSILYYNVLYCCSVPSG